MVVRRLQLAIGDFRAWFADEVDECYDDIDHPADAIGRPVLAGILTSALVIAAESVYQISVLTSAVFTLLAVAMALLTNIALGACVRYCLNLHRGETVSEPEEVEA